MFLRCKKCLVPNTRPRVKFYNGVCSACIFKKKKKKINWSLRWKELEKLCDKYRSKDGSHDVVVPCGGGKDSSYVAWVLKKKLKMTPLCVCATPPLFTKLGRKNLDNFVNSGFDLIEINPDQKLARMIGLNALKKYGQPQLEWLMRILVSPIKIASKFKIPFIMYGEEAESEYGGLQTYENKAKFNQKHIHKAYNSSITIKNLINTRKIRNISNYKLPSKSEYKKLFPTHWSYFEKWDENMHLKIAEKYCGLERLKKYSFGSYNNFSHLDQEMYLLHMYFAYLKFGFSRATTDASIDIREGNLTRKKGINLVKKLDHLEPKKYYKKYANYFGISLNGLYKIINKHRNKKIFKKINNTWKLLDTI